MTPKITINDIPLLAASPVQWALRGGVRPVVMEYDITPTGFERLTKTLGASNIVTLKIDLGNDKTLTVRNLYYLGNAVGINPKIKKILIADRRWLWNRHSIIRKYNIRRHTGIKRLTQLDVQELQDTVVAVRYAKYSVKTSAGGNVTKWTAEEIIEDIVKDLVKYEKEFYPGAASYVFRGSFKNDIPVENLRIDDSGSSALNKVLALISGSEISIDYNGRIVIYDKTGAVELNAESKIANNILSGKTPRLVNFGNVEQLDKSFLRPKEVRVMFHREVEMRFDATETTATRALFLDEDTTRSMDNVISLPDWTLERTAEDGKTTTDVQGTWIDIVTALNAWAALTQPDNVIAEFTMAYLRKAFVPFRDFWSPFLINGVFNPASPGDVEKDWAARVASIMNHWRRTFRINSNWIDRIAKLRAYRIATIDQATGQRSPAIAYANYCQVYTMRSLFFDRAKGEEPSYISNYENGLASNSAPITSDNKPTPARVSIVDGDQGIIGLDFLGDVYRLRENTIPGVVSEKITSNIATAQINNIAFDAIGNRNTTVPEIIDGTSAKPHVTTIILTAIPASPNDNRQYHVVRIRPEDLKELPAMKATGPPVEIIVGPSIETARIRWLDGREDDIVSLFGVGLEEEDAIALSEKVDDLVINRGRAGSITALAGSLEEIAIAVAYKVYLSLVNRMAGSGSINMQPDMIPRGYMDEVSQEVNPDGVAITRVASPVEIPELDLFGVLDENSRAAIMKMVEVEK